MRPISCIWQYLAWCAACDVSWMMCRHADGHGRACRPAGSCIMAGAAGAGPRQLRPVMPECAAPARCSCPAGWQPAQCTLFSVPCPCVSSCLAASLRLTALMSHWVIPTCTLAHAAQDRCKPANYSPPPPLLHPEMQTDASSTLTFTGKQASQEKPNSPCIPRYTILPLLAYLSCVACLRLAACATHSPVHSSDASSCSSLDTSCHHSVSICLKAALQAASLHMAHWCA